MTTLRRCWDAITRADPDGQRLTKGLRLVAGFAIASTLAGLTPFGVGLSGHRALPLLAGAFALWAALPDTPPSRRAACRDLTVLVGAAILGAIVFAEASAPLRQFGPHLPGLVLVTGAFLVGALRRFGPLGAGLGSQAFIGQLLAYAAGLGASDVAMIGVAGGFAWVGAILPGMLRPGPRTAASARVSVHASTIMGLQAATAVLAIVVLDATIGLTEPWWAMAGCTYVIAGTARGTIRRTRARALGTAVAVPLGLACAPLAAAHPALSWVLAAAAMLTYAVALPVRYDIACGAYSFALVVTMAGTGAVSDSVLAARLWDTLVGGLLGLGAAVALFPLPAVTNVEPRPPDLPDVVSDRPARAESETGSAQASGQAVRPTRP